MTQLAARRSAEDQDDDEALTESEDPDDQDDQEEWQACDFGGAGGARVSHPSRDDDLVDGGVEKLCETLTGLPPQDAEEDIRAALEKSVGEATDADTLAILLKVFRLCRDSALEGYDTWDCAVSYCDHITALCDKNFVGLAGGDHPDGSHDFPASAVAKIYVECGRTLALAELLPQARDKLQKGLNVFSLIGQGSMDSDESLRWQMATARASLARIFRRVGQPSGAQMQYMQALQLYAGVSIDDDLPEFLGELCDFLGTSEEPLSASLPPLLAELAEEKLGEGSDAHLHVLKDIASACASHNQIGLSAPALSARARLLRQRCLKGRSRGRQSQRSEPMAFIVAEAEAAEEEAAQALEAATMMSVQEADIAAAAKHWEAALAFRESLAGAESELVTEMRASLLALQQAAESMESTGPDGCGLPADAGLPEVTGVSQDGVEGKDVESELQEEGADAAEDMGSGQVVCDDWAELADAEPDNHQLVAANGASTVGESGASIRSSACPLSNRALSGPVGLRPAWASGRSSGTPSGKQKFAPDARTRQPAEDAWDA